MTDPHGHEIPPRDMAEPRCERVLRFACDALADCTLALCVTAAALMACLVVLWWVA